MFSLVVLLTSEQARCRAHMAAELQGLLGLPSLSCTSSAPLRTCGALPTLTRDLLTSHDLVLALQH